jgi:ureidoacrylate peracid hydrolase
VAVCGIVTNGGVASTVRDAHMREYHVHVLADACAAFTHEAHTAALADMGSIACVTASAVFEDLLTREVAP